MRRCKTYIDPWGHGIGVLGKHGVIKNLSRKAYFSPTGEVPTPDRFSTDPWGYGIGVPGLDGTVIDANTLPYGSYGGYNVGNNAVHEVGARPEHFPDKFSSVLCGRVWGFALLFVRRGSRQRIAITKSLHGAHASGLISCLLGHRCSFLLVLV